MKITYKPQGVCSHQMDVEIEDGKVTNVSIIGGCNGNLKGITSLVIGMDAQEVIKRLKGIKCGFKNSSCPDQLSLAIEQALNSNQ